MKCARFSARTLFFAGILFAAASASGVADAPPPAPPNSRFARLLSEYSLDCITEAEVIRAYREDAPAPAKESEGEKTHTIGRALAESFAYGQRLLGEYDRHLERGESLAQIRASSRVYAELQALYFLRHDLRELTGAHVAGLLYRRLVAGTGRHRDLGIARVRAVLAEVREELRLSIAKRSADPRYEILALAGWESAWAELDFEVVRCGIHKNEAGALDAKAASEAAARTARLFRAAKTLPKDPNAFRAFLPRTGEAGDSIVARVRRRGREIYRDWQVQIDPSPPDAPAQKIFYPDAGKPGNVSGTNFPKGVWALTFDDGPHGGSGATPSYTAAVLENLERHRISATFFILSQLVTREDCAYIEPRIRRDRPAHLFPELPRTALERRHAVESHSYYHSDLTRDTESERACEIAGAARTFADTLGARPTFFRLPYGAGVNTPAIRARIAAAGLIHVFWSVDTLDWQDLDPDSIVRRTRTAMRNDGRGVILFHDVHPQSVIASEKIMADLTNPTHGLEAVTLPQIVDRLNTPH